MEVVKVATRVAAVMVAAEVAMRAVGMVVASQVAMVAVAVREVWQVVDEEMEAVGQDKEAAWLAVAASVEQVTSADEKGAMAERMGWTMSRRPGP